MNTKTLFLGLFGLFLVSGTSAQQLGGGDSEVWVDTFNKELPSGAYQTHLTIPNYPQLYADIITAKHLFHQKTTIDGSQHAFQLSSFFNEDDHLYFRKITTDASGKSNYNSKWHELATRGENAYVGNQNIRGSVLIADAPSTMATGADRLEIKYWGNTSNPQENHGFIVYPSYLWFHPAGKANTEGIHFNSNGDVGIGTGSTWGYKLSVNGTIRAKEIRVESGWADFVFKKDYQLPSLQEVKAHIDEHQHLPGIPSEAEVKENGVGLAEMTTKLLQKVEELTLYAIQQQETIDKLNNKVQELENTKK